MTKETQMLLRCPHCQRSGEQARRDFFGDWVVCPTCELPFAWREARIDDGHDDEKEEQNTGESRNGRHRSPAR